MLNIRQFYFVKFALVFIFVLFPFASRSSSLSSAKISSPLTYSQFLQLFDAAELSQHLIRIEPIVFNVKAKVLGNVLVKFNRIKILKNNYTQHSSIETILLKGTATIGGKKVPVAGSIFKDLRFANVQIQLNFQKIFHNRFFHIQFNVGSGGIFQPHVTRASKRALSGLRCLSLHSDILGEVKVLDTPTDFNNASIDVKTFNISTDADWEWYKRYGEYSNAQIASILNVVETLYINQLGLDFNLVDQHVFSTKRQPYSQTKSDDLINKFASYSLNKKHLESADIYHLFTGKDLDGSVQGIAWVGVACNAPEYSFGLSQRVNAAVQAIITAHEIAHNFGASHDNSIPRTIMSAIISTPILSEFSAFSRYEVSKHIDSYGDLCLNQGVAEPTPTVLPGNGALAPNVELDVKLTRRGVLLAQAAGETPVDNCELTIIGSPIKRRVREGVVLDMSEPTLFLSEWEARIKRQALGRLVRGNRVKRARLFFIVKNSCAGYEDSFSNVSAIRANRINTIKRKIGRRRWLSLLRRKLAKQ